MLLFASLLLPSAHAGSACKVEADKFGGGTNVVATVQMLSQFTAIAIELTSKGGATELVLTAKTGGAVSGSVAAGVEMPLVFEDGTVKTLATAREAAMTSYVGSDQVMTLVPYALSVDAETLQLMATQPLTAVRFPLPSGNYDWDANKGVQKKLMAAAACVAENAAK